MFLSSKVRLVRRADNLTAICEPIAVTGIALLFFYFTLLNPLSMLR
jgi:hypothetical protein